MDRPRAVIRLVAAVVVFVVLVAACDSAAPPATPASPAPVTLDGTSWVVDSAAGRIAPAPRGPGAERATLSFSVDRITGFSGCNGFGGSYRYDPTSGQFQVRELASTLVGCLDNAVGVFESSYTMALSSAVALTLDANGRLHLGGPAGEVILERAGPAAD